MTAMEALRRNVVYKRAEHRISQIDLAQRASVARQTISKIESGNGNVTVDILEKSPSSSAAVRPAVRALLCQSG